MKPIYFCIKTISDHINGVETITPEEPFDWSKVITFFKCHELIGVLYYQCNSFIPNEYKKMLDRYHASEMYYYSNRIWLETSLKEIMSEKSIDFFLVKGSLVASFYPHPELRTMGDTDLVVRSEYREKIDSILISLGFANKSKNPNREWIYFYNNMELELHNRLIYYRLNKDNKCEEFFNDFWKYVKNGAIDWNFHFLFLIYHLRKHFTNNGVGFRHFLDIAVLTKNNKDLNWEWIKQNLIDLDMWEFTQRILFLNQYWFDVNSPLDITFFDKAFLYEATKSIYHNGVFGFDNEDNENNTTIRKIVSDSKKDYGIRNVVSSLFPSYEEMRIVSYYSFLNHRPYLLPIAWIYRYGRAIKSHSVFSKMIRMMRSSFVSKKKVQERKEELKRWGLE